MAVVFTLKVSLKRPCTSYHRIIQIWSISLGKVTPAKNLKNRQICAKEGYFRSELKVRERRFGQHLYVFFLLKNQWDMFCMWRESFKSPCTSSQNHCRWNFFVRKITPAKKSEKQADLCKRGLF